MGEAMNVPLGSIMSQASMRLAAIICLTSVTISGQAPPSAQPPAARQPQPPGQPAPVRKIPPRPPAIRIAVRDQSGTLLEGARVRISGSPEKITDKTGTVSFPPLKDGSY